MNQTEEYILSSIRTWVWSGFYSIEEVREMTDELLAYSVAKMRENGIVDSGDTLKLGIGAITDARMASFFDKMVRARVVKPTVDFRKAYSLRFVNKGVGLELRPKN